MSTDANRLDPRAAKQIMQKIIDWPDRFHPARGIRHDFQDVQFKHTGVIYVNTPTDNLRIEVDIDQTFYEDVVEYQHGGINVFKDAPPEKRLDIVTIDVEK